MYSGKIKSIKSLGVQDTYDLNTPVHHNFFLDNGILSKNSGKSYSAISMAKTIDPEFDASRVAFSTQEFMDLLGTDVDTGSAIVLDEAGVGVGSRSWHNRAQILFNQILQTFRHRNLVVFFTLPNLGMLDKQSRELAHCIIECNNRGIIKSLGVNNVKAKLVEINAQSGKAYYKFIRVSINHEPHSLKFIKTKKPDIKLVRAYEKRKEAFSKKLSEEVREIISLGKMPRLNVVQFGIWQAMKKEMSMEEMMDKFSMDRKRFNAVKDQMLAKGVKIPDMYHKNSKKVVSEAFQRKSFSAITAQTKDVENLDK